MTAPSTYECEFQYQKFGQCRPNFDDVFYRDDDVVR